MIYIAHFQRKQKLLTSQLKAEQSQGSNKRK